MSPSNRKIIERIIDTGACPHLLFHGPPGTGKTTTAMNLVDAIHTRHGDGGRECLIHLNASDDRGVDVIRQQIQRFVQSEGLFKSGSRFVILDEADYMTRCAQQSLRRLIQTTEGSSVSFCLICNYSTRIDAGLREELLTLRFHSLPPDKILATLETVAARELLALGRHDLTGIMRMYGSDVRSMINHMQSHRYARAGPWVSPHAFWERLTESMRECSGGLAPDAKSLLGAARESGMHVAVFMRRLINSAIRDARYKSLDGFRLLRLAEAVVVNRQADEDLLAEHCATELAGALSPHLSARSRSRALQELGGEGECGKPNEASVESSPGDGVLTGMASGAETADIL